MNDSIKATEFEQKAAAWEKRATDAAAAARTSHDPKIAVEYRRLAARYNSLSETSRKMAAFFHNRARTPRDDS